VHVRLFLMQVKEKSASITGYPVLDFDE